MRRNLHIKLVLIMVLLIVSLMVVVGAFLMNSVTGYYINDFYQPLADAFGQDNADGLPAVQDIDNIGVPPPGDGNGGIHVVGGDTAVKAQTSCGIFKPSPRTTRMPQPCWKRCCPPTRAFWG